MTQRAFEHVVTEHGATVLRVCRAVLAGRHAGDVDDAWSETFLAALRAYPDLPDDADVRAWLVTIAHRKAIDVTRRAARRAVPVAELPEHSVVEEPGSGAEVWRLVAALPTRQRLAVAYHHFGGLGFAEVAALIGGTPDAARRAAFDGRASLRKTLNTKGFHRTEDVL